MDEIRRVENGDDGEEGAELYEDATIPEESYNISIRSKMAQFIFDIKDNR